MLFPNFKPEQKFVWNVSLNLLVTLDPKIMDLNYRFVSEVEIKNMYLKTVKVFHYMITKTAKPETVFC